MAAVLGVLAFLRAACGGSKERAAPTRCARSGADLGETVDLPKLPGDVTFVIDFLDHFVHGAGDGLGRLRRAPTPPGLAKLDQER